MFIYIIILKNSFGTMGKEITQPFPDLAKHAGTAKVGAGVRIAAKLLRGCQRYGGGSLGRARQSDQGPGSPESQASADFENEKKCRHFSQRTENIFKKN